MHSLLIAIVAAWVAASSARALAYDFFFNPIPSDSSGSGFILDTRGHSELEVRLGELPR